MAKLKKFKTFKALKSGINSKNVATKAELKESPSQSEYKVFMNLLQREYSKKKKAGILNGK